MVNGRVWIVAAMAASVACAALAACGRDELAQPAREHGRTDEAAGGPMERAVIAAQRGSNAPAARSSRSVGASHWADSRRYTAEENASYQFDQHGDELGARDLDDFVAKARRFVNDPPAGARTLVRANGDRLIYDAESGLFGVARQDGAPRTVFKPTDGDAYWAQQVKQNEATAASAGRGSASGSEG